jgi:hypothetical protein
MREAHIFNVASPSKNGGVIDFSIGTIGTICIKTAVLAALTYKLATVNSKIPTRPVPSHATSGVVQNGNHPEV